MRDNTLDQIIANVVRETMPQTIRLRVEVAQTNKRVAPGGSEKLSIEQTCIEADTGCRFFEERSIDPNNPPTRRSSYCDGIKCANIRHSPGDTEKQQAVSIGHDFMTEATSGFREAPAPLLYYHVGLVPLYEALPAAERLGKELVIGRTCEVFHFKEVGPSQARQSLTYSLDQATSLPLKVAAYRGTEQLSDGAPNWVWEATTLDPVSGRHFARQSKYTSFGVSKGEDGRWVSTPRLSREITVREVTFDEVIPKTAFWPTLQPGVHVSDSIAKRRYDVAGAPPHKQASAVASAPVRVAEERGSWLPTVGITLSIAALLAAAVLWRRSR